ncbi:MAG: YcaO-like family protein [Desulfovibrionaceae bacterium]|nr:YcaO-like family protein [Desulfovibrionaceae bacterium]
MNNSRPITLSFCPKGYTADLDKAISPAETLARVRARFSACNLDILAETRRVDVGRLGIPVFMSLCGRDALPHMPTRKQMGKGSSSEQAEASAVMELVERYSYFSFWDESTNFQSMPYNRAEQIFGEACLDPLVIAASVNEDMPESDVRSLLDTCSWAFTEATDLSIGRTVMLPLDWFRLINEFNGSSAGNTEEESLLQGLCELIERHVCCLIEKDHITCPTLAIESCEDPTLKKLLTAFSREGIHLLLKDFSLDMPLPTVAAYAYDPATYPARSEIVFTAGTATQMEKAALRAVTEVAQLGGDFCTNACYEASGLPKYSDLNEADWLTLGPTVSFAQVKKPITNDIGQELRTAIEELAPRHVYALRTTHPKLAIPAHYTIVPGLTFRERDKNASLGLFIGRKLVEECAIEEAKAGLLRIEAVYGNIHCIPFFQGMLAVREGDFSQAIASFHKAVPLQPTDEAKALTCFYLGYCSTQQGKWNEAIPMLRSARKLAPDVREYANLLGVALFKTDEMEEALDTFLAALAIDKGSAIDLANLGLCEERLGKRKEAIAHFKSALALDPGISFAAEHLDALLGQK